MSPYRTFIRWLTPPEARPIADELVRQAQRVREAARQARAAGRALDETWNGGAKRTFSVEFDTLPGDLDRFASSLEAKAVAVSAISVWEEVKEWFEEAVRGR